MGTNFFARILPSRERKKQIKNAIDKNDFREIQRLINITYSSPEYDSEEGKYYGGEIHLGKRSGGWKFLWNPNLYKLTKGHTEEHKNPDGSISVNWVNDGYDVFKYYNLTKKSIKKFIDKKNVEIYDEYGEKQNKEEFWKMALEWGYEKDDTGWDSDSYEEWEKTQNPYRRIYVGRTDYINFLEELGYKLSKYKYDFYSNNLRFATTTEFR